MIRPTLLHVFSTFAVGGPQVRFAQLANHFGDDYRHIVIAMDGRTDCRARLRHDLDVTFLPVPSGRGLFARVVAYRRLLREIRPHLLITSNWGSIEWAMANMDGATRHLHLEDGFNPDEVKRQLPRRIWTRRLFLRHSTVLLPSQTLRAIARDVWRLPERCLVQVSNGIDLSRFVSTSRSNSAVSAGLSQAVPVIGTVATLRSEKNLSRLLEAFAIVRRKRAAQLVIVGDGPERSRLEANALALGIDDDVLFTGACPEPEQLLPAFTVFALSSDTEQMPISILEAMAAGRPIAATDVGDVKRMLPAESHPFVVPKDAPRLAKAILTLIDDAAQRQAVSEANVRRAREEYDQQRMFSAYRMIFDGKVL